VTIDDNNQVSKVEGNTCPRGEAFAHKEWTDPVRTLTSTVFAILGEKEVLVPVKTSQPISKKLMGKAMEEIQNITLTRPVTMGEEIIANLAGSGVSLVACKTYKPL
jgi:CxxC motif-containing protein